MSTEREVMMREALELGYILQIDIYREHAVGAEDPGISPKRKRYNELKEKLLSEPAKVCEWREDDESVWNTDCGHGWGFDDPSTPTEHDMKYCPFCSKELKSIEFKEESDD